jgi:DNA polymerase
MGKILHDEVTLLSIRDFLNLPPGKDEDILDDTKKVVAECTKCPALYNNGKVFEAGSRTADLMIIGEAPAKKEIANGTLFCGPAGEKLDNILAAPKINLKKEDLYICNALKCKLPGNHIKAKLREPHISEIVACNIPLQAQILAVNPKLIVACGNNAVRALFGPKLGGEPMNNIHGRLVPYKLFNREYEVIITFHPASILDRKDISPEKLAERKEKVYDDWLTIVARLEELKNES